MELLYPMVISAVAVLATLIYASYLDIKDRRVPFKTWYPMLIIGIPASVWLLYIKTGNYSLIAGYLTLIVSFFYTNYLDSHEPGERFRFEYLAVTLALPALAWLVLPSPFNLSLVPWYAMFAGIFGYISYATWKQKPEGKIRPKRKVREANVEEAFHRWYFILIVVILAITSVQLLFSGAWGTPAFFILLPAVFCGVFYLFGRMHLFGGADAWALIFIAFCVPTFPFTPLLGNTPLGFLAFTVLINALLLNLVAPLGIFLINIIRGNRAPLMYMFFGFPVQGETIQHEWGFVMEDFEEKKGVVSRKFIGFFDSIRRMYAAEGRIYTKDLREHPEEFTTELAIYKKAGTVWISYAVPFIIPITAGLITGIVFGDFLLAIMNVVIGG
ncbi:MAG: peptidase A24 [Methanomicrobiales archaeon HGW-Methanomicrobiales-1]|jgi:preflagellin peptidase FlaK|nr:MAG: peptidase A24 [Methanomicrobiales archaeon HGW-Methanomicrobiales-1]